MKHRENVIEKILSNGWTVAIGAEYGTIRIKGLHSRHPICIYASQLLELLDMGDELEDFIIENKNHCRWPEDT